MSNEEEAVTIFFLLPKGKTATTCSEDLSDAYDQATDHELSPSWMTSDQALSKKPLKTDVFVVDPFEGVGFEHLARYKCTIVGPRCLVTCLQKGMPVPNLPYPMYTASFRDLIITSTGFDKGLMMTYISRLDKSHPDICILEIFGCKKLIF